MENDRRLRIYHLGRRSLLTLLNAGHDCIYEVRNIPPGATIHHIWADMPYGCIAVAVEHESFEAVADGSQIPIADEMIDVRRSKVITDSCAISDDLSEQQLRAIRAAVDERLYDLERSKGEARADHNRI